MCLTVYAETIYNYAVKSVFDFLPDKSFDFGDFGKSAINVYLVFTLMLGNVYGIII